MTKKKEDVKTEAVEAVVAETVEAVVAETVETNNKPEIVKMEMPKINRKGNAGPRASKYDFLLETGEGAVAIFKEIADNKKAAVLRTTLAGWAKRRAVNLKTVFKQEKQCLYVSIDKA